MGTLHAGGKMDTLKTSSEMCVLNIYKTHKTPELARKNIDIDE